MERRMRIECYKKKRVAMIGGGGRTVGHELKEIGSMSNEEDKDRRTLRQ